jgi:hypothetical protein
MHLPTPTPQTFLGELTTERRIIKHLRANNWSAAFDALRDYLECFGYIDIARSVALIMLVGGQHWLMDAILVFRTMDLFRGNRTEQDELIVNIHDKYLALQSQMPG